LALRVAAEARRAFPDGVWLVEMAAVEKPELLVPTVADALGLRERSGLLDSLVAYLADKQMLLVLDNCEHLLDAAAALAGALLRSAAWVRILATSRQPLRVDGEFVFGVPAMSVPAGEDGHNIPIGALAQYESVGLFLDRASAVDPSFALTAENGATVARLCQRLDGIPLAIELAAVRLRALSPQQIVERLDDRFRLLTGGSRSALPRQQTLRAAIDWSFDLCTPAEQTLWARMSVFSGGFDLEAAEEVCSGKNVPREAVFDVVSALVDKSILFLEPQGSRVRYRLLDTLRQYGRQRLALLGEEKTMQRRHRDYYQRLAERAETEWLSPTQAAWCGWLLAERSNLRAALDFCLTEPGEAHVGLSIAATLWSHWIAYGFVIEGRHWLERALALADELTPTRAKALWVGSWIAIMQGDHAAAVPMLEECRALARQLSDESDLAYAVQYSAEDAMFQGNYAQALGLYEDALRRHRALDDQVGVTTLLLELALCYCLLQDIDHSIALCKQCLSASEAAGEIWCRSLALYVYGLALWLDGKPGEADKLVRDSLRLKLPLNDHLGINMGLELLACIEAAKGHYARAVRLIGAARRIWQTIGSPLFGIAELVGYHEQAERQTRDVLGAAAFQGALQEGMDLTLDQAVSYALSNGKVVPGTSPGLPAVHVASTVLTSREWEVAKLIAQGKSNKEIAATLVIAQRTAENHVEHILTKLGFTSRAQIAAWAAEQRYGGPSVTQF
jgi:non-specific serine/threonine protein kinase